MLFVFNLDIFTSFSLYNNNNNRVACLYRFINISNLFFMISILGTYFSRNNIIYLFTIFTLKLHCEFGDIFIFTVIVFY